jgi:hypothetical protein
VLLSALQSALAVVPCCGSNAGSSQTIKVLPCGPPYVVVDPFAPAAKQLQQQQNSTCAVVRLTPGLPASGVAILRLPKGVRYNTVSGPTKNDTEVYVSSYGWQSRGDSGVVYAPKPATDDGASKEACRTAGSKLAWLSDLCFGTQLVT